MVSKATSITLSMFPTGHLGSAVSGSVPHLISKFSQRIPDRIQGCLEYVSHFGYYWVYTPVECWELPRLVVRLPVREKGRGRAGHRTDES